MKLLLLPFTGTLYRSITLGPGFFPPVPIPIGCWLAGIVRCVRWLAGIAISTRHHWTDSACGHAAGAAPRCSDLSAHSLHAKEKSRLDFNVDGRADGSSLSVGISSCDTTGYSSRCARADPEARRQPRACSHYGDCSAKHMGIGWGVRGRETSVDPMLRLFHC